ncbi:MAG: hypothetical protein ACP5G0_05945 [Desulfomonilia bacterium]
MSQYRSRRSEKMVSIRIQAAIFFLLCCMGGCLGGGSSNSTSTDDSIPADRLDDDLSQGWEGISLEHTQAGGMLSTHVKAVADSVHQAHVVFFTDSSETSGQYSLNHLIVDLDTYTVVSRNTVVEVDNCRTLSLTIGDGDVPVVAYQGGEIRQGGSEQQSDVMFSIFTNGLWDEYTGGIGYVERNPVFEDGLAGKHVSTAVDTEGNIHLCYQFFYEGIDAMNFNYPDLLYVKKDGTSPEIPCVEETVEGNLYNANGTASEQNAVGEYAQLILDSQENPVIFYAADLDPDSSEPSSKGLRVARKSGGSWTSEWIESGVEVAGISCARRPQGDLAVAYYVEGEYADSMGVHSHCLKYAVEQGDSWSIMMVDESTWCGRYPALAFDEVSNPGIAYYSLQNHSGSRILKDLKCAVWDGVSWSSEVVASAGDIGLYNSLWFDEGSTPYICTYSRTYQTIYLFHR